MLINNFTLLYVEDEVEAQEQMKMMLEDDVKEFYQAFNGEEGLKLFKELNPDIILTDINMPLLDGLSMSQEIKNIDDEKPIIIMSAFDDRKTLLRALNMGIDYFTPKPIDMDIVNRKLEKIAKHLQNKIDAENARKKEMEYLQHMAHYDILTKVPNRFLFDLKLDQAISRAKRNDSVVLLFFIDLDNFKSINDTYGHGGGDIVLKTVSKNIQNVIRKEDTLARISGDEFSVIIEDITDMQYIDTLAKKIIEASSTSIDFEGKKISITCSVGISKFPHDSIHKKELIHFADIAMYKAKHKGKATYEYYVEGDSHI